MDDPAYFLAAFEHLSWIAVLIFVAVYRVVIVFVCWGFVLWCLLVLLAFMDPKTLSRLFEAPFWWRHWDPEWSFANCILSQRWLGRSATSRTLKGKWKKISGKDGRKRGRSYSDISRSSTRDPWRGLRSTAAVMREFGKTNKSKTDKTKCLGSWHSHQAKLHHAIDISPWNHHVNKSVTINRWKCRGNDRDKNDVRTRWIDRYQQMELPMFQGLPFSSHRSGGALRASACHAVVRLSVRCCLKKYMADLRRSTCGKSLCVSQVITPGMEGVACGVFCWECWR